MTLSPSPKVGLFVTCLVDLMRPSVGFAALRLLERAGAQVVVPDQQTCCGQPAYNSGDFVDAADIARGVIEAFEGFDHVVAPSGSCAGMIRVQYPELFKDDSTWRLRAEDLASRTFELCEYLVQHLDLSEPLSTFNHTVTYHDSCAARREMGVIDQPRQLMAAIKGLDLKELADTETCCGFGGLFSVKFAELSDAIADTKAQLIDDTKVEVLLGGDLGCLLKQADRLKQQKSKVRVFHIGEVLAGMADGPGVDDA